MYAAAPNGPRSAERSRCAAPGHTCAAGDPELRHEIRPNEHDGCQPCLARRANGHLRHHPLRLPRSPPPEYFTPLGTSVPEFVGSMYTSSGRSLGLNGCLSVHFGCERSRRGSSERPLRTVGRAIAPAMDVAVPAGPTASTIRRPLGRVAQWESARFTRERSQVRNPPRPLETPRF